MGRRRESSPTRHRRNRSRACWSSTTWPVSRATEPAHWVRVHTAGSNPRRDAAPSRANGTEQVAYRVSVDAGAKTLGALWAVRQRDQGEPAREETRVLAAAADQIGRALERDRLGDEAASVEITRRSDTLKSALLDSVSHDLRTPLASIRAAAGTLMDPDVEWPPERRREIAASIDREADWLNRLVTNLLDMSRVDAGELRPNLAVFALADLVGVAVARANVASGGRDVRVDVPEDLPPVLVDEVLDGPAPRQHPRQRGQVRGARCPDPGQRGTRGGRLGPADDRGRRSSACRPRPCRGCSRSSTASPARVRARGGAPASVWPWSAASSRPWADRSGRVRARSAASRSTSTCRSRRRRRRPGRRVSGVAGRVDPARRGRRADPPLRSPRSSSGHGHEVDAGR